MRPELLEVVVAIEYDPAGEHFKQHAPERVDVGAAVDVGTVRLLGRDVVDRAERHPGPGQVLVVGAPGDAEVGQVSEVLAGALESSTLAGLTSRWTSPSACASSSAPAIWSRIATARVARAVALPEQSAQVDAVDIPHRQVEQPVLLPGAVDLDYVRVIDRRRQPALPLEPGAEHRVADGIRRDQLQRHRPIQRQVGRPEHHPIPPWPTKLDPMPGEVRADGHVRLAMGETRVRAGGRGRHLRAPGAKARVRNSFRPPPPPPHHHRLARRLLHEAAAARSPPRPPAARFCLHRQHHDRAPRGRLEEPGNRRERRSARHVEIEHDHPRPMSS